MNIRAFVSVLIKFKKNLHVSGSSSVHHQEFINVHTAIYTGLLTASC